MKNATTTTICKGNVQITAMISAKQFLDGERNYYHRQLNSAKSRNDAMMVEYYTERFNALTDAIATIEYTIRSCK